MTSMRGFVVLLWLTGSTTGCFHYVPAADVPTQGTAVRVQLDPPVRVDLPDLTANDIVRVQGEMVGADTDRLILSAFSLHSAAEREHIGGGATVYLPRESLGLLEVRRLSVGRTALASVAVAGAGFLVGLAIDAAAGGGGEGGGGTPPPK